MENHVYHIRWAPLSVTIFITHERILRNGSNANEYYQEMPQSQSNPGTAMKRQRTRTATRHKEYN